MVATATAARLAGDWRAACAAARVDVQFDLAEVATRFGPGEARRIEADPVVDWLRQLAGSVREATRRGPADRWARPG
jgi:hypothetical protein